MKPNSENKNFICDTMTMDMCGTLRFLATPAGKIAKLTEWTASPLLAVSGIFFRADGASHTKSLLNIYLLK
jgi:hypothetical protein